MKSIEVLLDAFGRISRLVHETVGDLGSDQLNFRASPRANSIAWLVWHLTRIQDDHVCAVDGSEQAWTACGWSARFALPFDAAETGYGQGADDVAAVRVESGSLLSGYHADVYAQTRGFLGKLSEKDLDRVVDRSFDPPVTLGVRLVSVVADDLQHVGQAAFVRGLVLRA